jgi:hypothetical protein
MQTFLPHESFEHSASVLDYRRLGKQRVETYQLLRGLLGVSQGWLSHPASLMWRGYEPALALYGIVMCNEWVRRGYKDTCRGKIDALVPPEQPIIMPPWLGREDIHSSHRSNLLRKAPDHYGQFGWREPDDLPYVWPVKKEDESNAQPL